MTTTLLPMLAQGDGELFKLLIFVVLLLMTGFGKLVETLAKKAAERQRKRVAGGEVQAGPAAPVQPAARGMPQAELERRLRELLGSPQPQPTVEPSPPPAQQAAPWTQPAPPSPRQAPPSMRQPPTRPVRPPPQRDVTRPMRARLAPPPPAAPLAGPTLAETMRAEGIAVPSLRQAAGSRRRARQAVPMSGSPRVLLRSKHALRSALVLKEILDRPVALRDPPRPS
jgi:hypothetical protein